MITPVKQLLGKLESTEGTAIALTSIDAALAYEPSYDAAPNQFKRNPVRDSLSKLGHLTGQLPATMGFKLEMRGSGNHVTTAPPFGRFVQACDLLASTLKTLTIGAVTTGPFQAGEKITGATSLATGLVVKQCANGITTLYIIVTGGTFQSAEVITGSDSGATATTSSTATAVGYVYQPRPIRECGTVDSMSLDLVEAGPCDVALIKKMKGARGNLTIDMKLGEPVMLNFDMRGVYVDPVDGTLVDDINYGTTKPPVLLDAAFSFGGYAAIISAMSINMNNVLALRSDVNDAHGGKSVWVVDRDPEGTYDPELTIKANHDFYGLLTANTEMYAEITIGATTGNKFIITVPKAQYRGLPGGDRDGITILNPTFGLNGKNVDTDFFILCL